MDDPRLYLDFGLTNLFDVITGSRKAREEKPRDGVGPDPNARRTTVVVAQDLKVGLGPVDLAQSIARSSQDSPGSALQIRSVCPQVSDGVWVFFGRSVWVDLTHFS